MRPELGALCSLFEQPPAALPHCAKAAPKASCTSQLESELKSGVFGFGATGRFKQAVVCGPRRPHIRQRKMRYNMASASLELPSASLDLWNNGRGAEGLFNGPLIVARTALQFCAIPWTQMSCCIAWHWRICGTRDPQTAACLNRSAASRLYTLTLRVESQFADAGAWARP